MRMLYYVLILALALMPGFGPASADEIRVAVASNFTDAIKDVAEAFEKKAGHEVVLISGSTGKHYAQIINGAPFDAFFAADARRPRLLEEESVAVPGSRFTYAIGKLVLWSPDPALIDANARVLSHGNFRHLALANPKLAPYGKAAEQVMRARGVWEALQGRMVHGENVGQTFQFVKTGNAELGFVAYSQIKRAGDSTEGSFWEPPQSLYTPIEQQAVLLKDHPVARELMGFAKGDQARKIIRAHGYGTP
ncbi:MAG: molybdate ABC transporter substrate-binding protein [Thiogranum sp.]|nr:molybdate ABC transporter substrate-binding protein [Thiogranum sp.]